MKAINFVVRTSMGAVQRSEISADNAVTAIPVQDGAEISLNLRQGTVETYVRNGSDLQITLADGRMVVLENFFGADDARLFFSSGGYLDEVTFVQGDGNTLYAQYGPTAEWGKWSPSDDLIFMSEAQVAPAVESEVSMLGAGLLGGSGLLGVAGAGAAALGTAAVIGGGGGDGGTSYTPPTVNEEETVVIGGDDTTGDDMSIPITGTAEPGSDVVVTIGDEVVETVADDNGEWAVDFDGEDFPADGEYDVVVVVTEPDGTETELDGPAVQIDLTPPDATVIEGTVSVDDMVNAEDHADDVTLTGSAEAGSTVVVTIDGTEIDAVVSEDGSWSVDVPADVLPEGEYDADVVITVTDAAGNSTTITDVIHVDTVAVAEIDAVDAVVNAEGLADGVTLTGTTQPGSTVVVTIEGQDYPATVGDDGSWTLELPDGTLPDGEYTTTATVTATDAAGNVATASQDISVDTVAVVDMAPQSSVINAESLADGVTLTGTTQPGSSVVVTLDGQDYPADVTADGSWILDVPAGVLPEGEYTTTATVTSTDAAGNVATTTQDITVDTVATATVDVADDLVNAADWSNGVTLTGTAQPGSTVDVTLGDVTHTVTAGADGTWSTDFEPSEIPEGAYASDVVVTATDPAGNTATATGTLDVDTTSAVDFSDTPVEGEGTVNAMEMADGVTLTGTTIPGSQVTVTVGDVSRQATVDTNGNWTVDFVAGDLPEGEYQAVATVQAISPAGNLSSDEMTFMVDTVNSVDLSAAPVEGDNTVNAAERSDGVTVTGTTQPGSTVEVDMGGVTRTATVDANGDWTVTFLAADVPQGEQDVAITATSTDAAGNVSVTNATLHVDTITEVDVETAGVAGDGVVNGVEQAQGVMLTGTTEPGSTVVVTVGGVSHNASVDANGNWNVPFAASELPTGETSFDVIATSTDAAGNMATSTGTVAVDTFVRNFDVESSPGGADAVVNGVEANGVTLVSGTTEPGSSLLVELNGVTVAATVAPDGSWTASFPAGTLPTGETTTQMVVTATDPAGNVATDTQTIQIDTFVNELEQSGLAVEGDNIVNHAEAADGVTLNGTVEEGSTVIVNFDGTDYMAIVDANGNWTVDVPASGIRSGQYDANIVITATDAAGNVDSISDTLAIDTISPDGPVVESYTRDLNGYRGISTDISEDDISIYEVPNSGSISEVNAEGVDISVLGETAYGFETTVPDGSHLIVTASDDAGNRTGTYLVLDETSTSVVDMSNPDLGNYQIESIDLQFAEDSQLTITEAQLINLSTNSDSVTVQGGPDDTLTISGATSAGSTVGADGQTYQVYSLGEGTVVVDDDINVVI